MPKWNLASVDFWANFFLSADEVSEAAFLLFSKSPSEIVKYCAYLLKEYIDESAQFQRFFFHLSVLF